MSEVGRTPLATYDRESGEWETPNLKLSKDHEVFPTPFCCSILTSRFSGIRPAKDSVRFVFYDTPVPDSFCVMLRICECGCKLHSLHVFKNRKWVVFECSTLVWSLLWKFTTTTGKKVWVALDVVARS